MDDVLLDYDLDVRLEHLAALSGRPPEDVRRDIWDSGFEDEADAGRWPDSESYLHEFGRRLGYPLTRAEWIAARRRSMTPFEDMLQLVDELGRQYQLAVLTNNVSLLRETLDDVAPQVKPLFGEKVFFSCDFGLAKPGSETVHAHCRDLQARAGAVPVHRRQAGKCRRCEQGRHDRHPLQKHDAVQGRSSGSRHPHLNCSLPRRRLNVHE